MPAVEVDRGVDVPDDVADADGGHGFSLLPVQGWEQIARIRAIGSQPRDATSPSGDHEPAGGDVERQQQGATASRRNASEVRRSRWQESCLQARLLPRFLLGSWQSSWRAPEIPGAGFRLVPMEFRRIGRFPPYVFAVVNDLKAAARRAGEDVIDLGMGNPDIP